jgi:exodeoxyribonuclease VII large subunit
VTDRSPPSALANEPGSNLPVFGVSELSQAVKRTLEGTFEHVRVRGEISGFKRAASGHLYLALKDQDAVLDAVCWRGTAGRLSLRPEDGMEVIATGRITSYPARSKYQLVIERLELAGEGALLKLLEDRRKALAAEGLFEAARKQPLPYLPSVIGVVTSPTGAVIRDILHRLADRFPRHVLVWPVLVQGEGAAAQVAAAIRGFNALPAEGAVPRPDLLIVARGGGSLEDLWAFNEEVVVRAAAESAIPLISAVGHETDTTLIDYAADRRAPTPTAAAEIAVPVRGELVASVMELTRRVVAAAGRMVEERRQRVEGLGRGLPDPRRLLEDKTQRLDDRAERLGNAMSALLRRRAGDVESCAARIPHPRHQLARADERLEALLHRLRRCAAQITERSANRLAQLDAERRLRRCRDHLLTDAERRVTELGRMLDSLSYHEVLKRGFAVVRGPDGVIMDAAAVTAGLPLDIEFRGDQHAAAVGAGSPPVKSKRRSGGGDGGGSQGTLL